MKRGVVVAVVIASLVATGCARSSDQATKEALAALAVQPTTTTTPASPPTTAPSCANPTASLAPQGALPAPGTMPAGSFMATIQQRGRLIVGVDQTTLLFGYLNPQDGQIEGFDIDMLRQVAKAIFGDDGQNENTRMQFVAITSAQRIPFVQSGQVDIVADTMTINCARDQQVDFSSVYYDAGQRVLVPDTSTIASSADLGGKKVCAAAGSTSIQNVLDTTTTHAKAPAQPVSVANWTDCLVALESGTVDAVSTDDTILAGLAAQDPLSKIVGPKFTDEPYGMAINMNHPDFVRFVNGVLAQMRSNGTWAAIWTRWLSQVYGPTPPPPPAATYRG
jgi:polar amino acid transport system substrate-binding protein